MSGNQAALLTFSIGPVHGFIAQARRISDFWAGSALLSELMGEAVRTVFQEGGTMIFPFVENASKIPKGLPNRFVCRVSLERVAKTVKAMEMAVRDAWTIKVQDAIPTLGKYGLAKAGDTADPIEIAWSWVPEGEDYARASENGARKFAASRVFRPFGQTSELGEKCRLCGERTALPDGGREAVRANWKAAEEKTSRERSSDAPFFRFKQGCLCLVCATKRLSGGVQEFSALDRFQPLDENDEEVGKPYYALVCMDGDKMGQTLGIDTRTLKNVQGLEEFHKAVSITLIEFADSLRSEVSADLKLKDAKLGALGVKLEGRPPQLIYAGGEDVVFVCDPRDALPLAQSIRERYKALFSRISKDHLKPNSGVGFTISAGILFVHVKHPAGLAFRDAEELLKRKAKNEEGRDAVAIKLDKRGGSPVEVAFKWDEGPRAGQKWIDSLNAMIALLKDRTLSSKQSYNLAQEERTLGAVFKVAPDHWKKWLVLRLGRGGGSKERAEELAELMAPFFVQEKTEALRIARFLGAELAPPEEEGRKEVANALR
jgi:CRISPR-associated protein Cmr2